MRKESGGDGPMSEQEEAQVKKAYGAMRKLYMERRRTALEVLGHMSEAQGKRTRALMEEMGIELDDEYGVDHKQFPVLM